MFFRSARKNTNLEDGVDISYFLSSFVEFRSEEKSKMSQSIRGRGSHLVFLIGPKKKLCTGHWYLASCQVSSNNTNLVEDVEILLPVKFRWILFSGHRGEVENVSANQRLGGHLIPPIDPKNTTLLEDVEILHPVKFCWIPFSGFRGKSKMPQPITSRSGFFVPPIDPKNTNVIEDIEILVPVNFVEFNSSVSEEKPRMSAIQKPGGQLVFPIGRTNTSLVEDVKILLPSKFRWIPNSGHRGEVENVPQQKVQRTFTIRKKRR